MDNQLIGKVTVDLESYSGSDLYVDGFEESILTKLSSGLSPESILEKDLNWGTFYHLSTWRENILKWYPFLSKESILEVGAGCGAITGALCETGNPIVSIDLSYQRSLINAYRHSQYNNLTLKVGNFNKVAQTLKSTYGFVTFIGVLEYAGLYSPGIENPIGDLLKKASFLLKPHGKILIAIENRMGLKYWAGCREDHTGRFFDGLNGYDSASKIQTLTKKEWETLLEKNGFQHYQFYYPYPDYKFMSQLYTDDYLPKENELLDNLRNFDADRFILFDETKVYNMLLNENMFPSFANSFFIEVEKREE